MLSLTLLRVALAVLGGLGFVVGLFKAAQAVASLWRRAAGPSGPQREHHQPAPSPSPRPRSAAPRLLQRAEAALEAGRRSRARRLLRRVVRADPASEQGWLRLAQVATSRAEQRSCLVRVLRLNPHNRVARRRLDALLARPRALAAEAPGGARVAVAQADSRQPGGAPDLGLHGLWLDSLGGTPVVWALVYLAAISGAEVLTALVVPGVGLALHALLLVALLFHAAATWDQGVHRLLLSLSLAPLIRMLSLSLPLAGFPTLYWYLIISVPLFAAVIVAVRSLNLGAEEIGLTVRRPLLELALSVAGILFGFVEYQILRPAPLAQRFAWQELWWPALILLISTGFAEELIFRGVLQRVTGDVLGPRWGILYVAALFAVLHVGYQSALDVVFVFGVAVVFGWVRERSGSLLGVTLAHGLTNIVLFLVAPFWIGSGGPL